MRGLDQRFTSHAVVTVFICFLLTGCGSDPDRNHANEKSETEHSEKPPHWDYSASEIDAAWAHLSTAYAPCADGKQQSPINIVPRPRAGAHDLEFHYSESHELIENNGHTIQLTYDSGSYAHYDNKRFDLVQFHFHTPSEHHVSDEVFPLEMHMVHVSKDTNYLVYSVLFRKGAENAFINSFIGDVAQEQVKRSVENTIDISSIIDSETQNFGYEGSFTTPPCTEGVIWCISADPRTVAQEQITKIQTAEGFNARSGQDLYDREVELF